MKALRQTKLVEQLHCKYSMKKQRELIDNISWFLSLKTYELVIKLRAVYAFKCTTSLIFIKW
ncbi:hypothetical protein THZG08_80071 [Vibrio owensii]|nr:hypothetical protein THZG08_80071 [Vibrio owensii]CAH1592459.1 hypothetical protein THOA03_80071 [Vibrio owensii]